jgi:hypothetical protein
MAPLPKKSSFSGEADVAMKDRKRRSEGGEWEPQIFFKIFGRCPNVTTKRKQVPETQIPKSTGDESTLIDFSEW